MIFFLLIILGCFIVIAETDPSISVVIFDENTTEEPYVTKALNHNITLFVEPVSVCRIAEENASFYDMVKYVDCTGISFIKCKFSEKSNRTVFDEDNPNGDYALFVSCRDGNEAENSIIINYTIAVPVPDIISPTISNVRIEEITNQSAIIKWTTDESTNSRLDYNKNISKFELYKFSEEFVINHLSNLTGLVSNTTYYFNVTSCDSSENCNLSSGFSFKTKETKIFVDNEAPVIYNHEGKVDNNVSMIDLKWKTDEPAKTIIYYGYDKYVLNYTVFEENYSLIHELNLTEFENLSDFYYKMNISDKYNNTIETIVYHISLFASVCTPSWECGNWSECEDGEQGRECIDNNKCGTQNDKPNVEKECVGECENNNDCNSSEMCDNGKCVIAECSSDEDCKDNKECDKRKCIEKQIECTTDEDCEQGETCYESECRIIDEKEKISTTWVIIWASTILVVGLIVGVITLYAQGKIPKMNFLKELFGPLFSKSKKKQVSKHQKLDPLKSYIDQMKKAGYSDDQIYHNLLRYGYTPDQISKYF